MSERAKADPKRARKSAKWVREDDYPEAADQLEALADEVERSAQQTHDFWLPLLEAVEKRGSWHSGELQEMARRAREALGDD